MKLLYATDFSHTAEIAHPLALDLSQKLNAQLDSVYVQERYEDLLIPPKAADSSVYLDYAKRMEEAKTFETNHYRSRLAYYTANKGEAHLLWGKPVAKLLEFSNNYDLIIMGAHGANRLDTYFLGGVAGRLVRRSQVPILTVRDEATSKQIKRLLVATNFSEAAKYAWEWLGVLRDAGIEVITAHVIDEESLQKETGYVQAVSEALALYSQSKAAEEIVRTGKVASELSSLAQEIKADAIVLGIQQQKNALGLLLGSQADRLLRSSPVPILSVPFASENTI